MSQMTKSFSLLIFFSYLFSCTFAQAPVQWTKCYGGVYNEWGNAVQQTTDGGYITAGVATSDGGDVTGSHNGVCTSCIDFWVIKTDSLGQIQWQRCLGGSYDDWASSVKQTQDGGYIVAGYTHSPDGDAMCTHCALGDPDFLIIKLDVNGNIQWHKCYGGANGELANAVVQTQDSGYLITGVTNSNNGDVSGNHGNSDYWLLKLNNAGDFQWQKTYGGSGNDIANIALQTSDGGYILAGSSTSSDGDVAQNHGAADFWIVKTNSLGQIIWEKNYGGSGNDIAYSISETTDGGFIAAGTSNSNDGDVSANHGNRDFWVIKISSSGLLKWEKSLGGSGIDDAYGIIQTPDCNYLAGGTSNSKDGDLHAITIDASPSFWPYENAWIVKLDTNGNIIWESCYGGTNSDEITSLAPANDGGFCFTGITQTNNNGDVSGFHGSRDVWFVKLSPVSLINIQAAVCIQCNAVATAIPFAGTPPFNFMWSNGDTTATTTLLCPGVSTLTVTDAAGTSSSGYFRIPFVNDFSLFMTQTPASCYACPDGSATVHTTGGNGFQYAWEGFPDTTATLSGQPRGRVKCCVTDSLGCVLCDSIEILSPVGFSGSTLTPSFFIYPNPATNTFKMLSADNGLKEIEIFNPTGQQVYRAEVTAQITIINLAGQPKGVYFIKATGNKEKMSYSKIIIQ